VAEILAFRPAAPSTTPPDAEARTQALDIRQSWIVEAPAGSGKTSLLIQRFLKLLADDSVTDPAQVLAITFTVKATNELRERVLAQLAAAQATEPADTLARETRPLAEAVLARDLELGWKLLQNPRRLAIRTITSVARSITQSLPILSGSSAGTNISTRGWELHRDAARRTLMLLGGDDPELSASIETLLLHRDGNLADCEALLAGMLPWRDQWGELIPLTRSELDDAFLEAEVLPKIEGALELAICRTLTRVAARMPLDLQHRLAALAQEMSFAPGYKEAASPLAICRELKEAPGRAAEDLALWRALASLLITASSKDWRAGFNKNQVMFEIEPSHRAQLKQIVDSLRHDEALRDVLCEILHLPPVKFPPEQWVVAKALFRVLSRTLVELQIVFAQAGVCDFVEVDLLAKSALRQESSPDDLLVANGTRLQHLLVDEMQDTSTSQYDLIRLLTQSWDGQSQTLFLVGDPKQSIYLFRQARVERFLRTMLKKKLGDIELGYLQLTANFRSQAALVDAFNGVFSRIFPPHADAQQPEEVPYVQAAAMRRPSAAHGAVWHLHPLPFFPEPEDRFHARQDRSIRDAREIRRIVERWRKTPLPPGRTAPWKIAVLVRARDHLREIVAALRPLPLHAVEIDPLAERPEILDLIALTRALLHPADRVAWFALLRAPWCGLTVVDLHRLAGADDPAFRKHSLPRLMHERGHELSPGGCERLAHIWTVMQAATAKRGRLSLSQWVERTWRSLGADAFASSEQMANVQQYLRLLDEAEEPGGLVSIAKLQGWLDQLYAETPPQEDAIDLMTIHRAKGLEWDVVIVPALERQGKNRHGRLLNWMELDGEDDTAHGILAPIRSRGGSSKQLNDWMNGIESAREAAERKRLFYVACTRAREELHLFASPATSSKGELILPSNTLLASAWPAAQLHVPPATPPEFETLEEEGLALAAATEEPPSIQRIPLTFLAAKAAKQAPASRGNSLNSDSFDRPEGSFAARAFGNAVHAFLERL
jgi:ATP-dependent helicase/nuclease subunit A